MFGDLAQLAIGNLLRARTRLVMTAGGVVVGTSAVILLIALTFGLQQAAEAGIGQSATLTEIEVYPNWGFGPVETETRQLDLATVRELWEIPNVQVVLATVYLRGGEIWVGNYVGYTQFIGVHPDLLPYLGITVSEGEATLGEGKMLIGSYTGEYFFDPNFIPEEGEEPPPPQSYDLYTNAEARMRLFNNIGEQRDLPLQPVGRIAEGSSCCDYAIVMALEDVMRLNEWISDAPFDPETFIYDRVVVRASSRETTAEVSQAIRDMGLNASGLGDYLDDLNNFFQTMRLMLGGVGGVALLVAAFGVANTMMMAILERTKEIGLMKAIGASDREVLTIFLIEAGLVGFIGGSLGVGLSLFLQRLINRAVANIPTDQTGGGFNFLPIDVTQIGDNLIVIPTILPVLALVLATGVGLAAGFFPALRAARLSPVIALKQE